MRLLYTADDGRLAWTDDLVGDQIPRYAILSHTWGEQEVAYKDLQNYRDIEDVDARLKGGYQKIFFCAAQAKRDGLDYFWVDTCCIDKANNTELSKAINSMFRWYQRASMCYVYLSDVPVPDGISDAEAFRCSRWFTRGWTLQELLAPPSVEFFCKQGKRLGTRVSLQQEIHEITQIPIAALRGHSLRNFRVEARMDWAARRTTTIKEDKVYCLLGIFGVFLSLIYGEGEAHARLRLEEEVRKRQKGHGTENIRELKDVSWVPSQGFENQLSREEREAQPEYSGISNPTQASTYKTFQSLNSPEPVLNIPTKEIELFLKRLQSVQHEEIAEVIFANCRLAAFEFYRGNDLKRTKFDTKDKRDDPRLFQLPNGKFPQTPDDLDLRSWICKIQHASGRRINEYDSVSVTAIRDYFSKDRYHFGKALNILRMLHPWKTLNPEEFEPSLCYAISWCRHLYASDCENRLNSLWVEIHQPITDPDWTLNLNRAKPPDFSGYQTGKPSTKRLKR